MSRLIDADDFIKKFNYAKANTEEENIMCATVRRMIQEQPIAFNSDKVMEQIEYRRANFDCKLCKYNDDEKTICSEDCSDALIDGLIEIIKGGGI
ncbi:hypothetical protein JYQ78_00160 [Anaerobutyricum hallii]|uniref:hypothetical protein n=1 Tax=Anaerobutyricum hallii TaxID=39488 RepID=UPI001ADD7C9B|nr:hypothetical protein [Anaerobutyricum hallii]MBP0061690.1 hypothetical protein [Anaerobutyricum hallii]